MFKETEETITLHGLGFLQIKLEGNQRLHIWHPDLPRRKCFEHSSIHDHRFSFESLVLVGTQYNQVYRATMIDPDNDPSPFDNPKIATHIAYLHEGERTVFGNRPWIPHFEVAMEFMGEQEVKAGRSYNMLSYCYHATRPGGDGRVATIMRKTSEGEQGAHSLCEVGYEPDVDFDRKQWSQPCLWDIVNDVLGKRS